MEPDVGGRATHLCHFEETGVEIESTTEGIDKLCSWRFRVGRSIVLVGSWYVANTVLSYYCRMCAWLHQWHPLIKPIYEE